MAIFILWASTLLALEVLSSPLDVAGQPTIDRAKSIGFPKLGGKQAVLKTQALPY